jgi:hypothetical protein
MTLAAREEIAETRRLLYVFWLSGPLAEGRDNAHMRYREAFLDVLANNALSRS